MDHSASFSLHTCFHQKITRPFPCQPKIGHSSTSTTYCLSVLMPTIHIQVQWLTNYGFLHTTKYCTIHKAAYQMTVPVFYWGLRSKGSYKYCWYLSLRSAKNVSLRNHFICKMYQSQVDLLWQSHWKISWKLIDFIFKRYQNNRKFVQDTVVSLLLRLNEFILKKTK